MSLSHIVLSSGRSIELTELRMSSTYGGMSEGYPCKRVNDMKVSSLQRQAERASPSTPVHLEHVLRSAGLTGRSPADVAERLTALGYRLPDEVEYPEVRAVLRG